MPNLKKDVALTMSMLEIHMHPNFFVVILQLVINPMEELEFCRFVHTNWMYGVETMTKSSKVM